MSWTKVFVVFYNCKLLSNINQMEFSSEHTAIELFNYEEVAKLKMYSGFQDILLKHKK
jgi:hypothetical protein